MTIGAYEDRLTGGCGVVNLFGFMEQYKDSWSGQMKPSAIGPGMGGGAGWSVAAFIPTPTCKEAYEKLCETHKLVFQTPVRRNNNSGNPFIFCVFDKKRSRKGSPMEALEPNWPFKKVIHE